MSQGWMFQLPAQAVDIRREIMPEKIFRGTGIQ